MAKYDDVRDLVANGDIIGFAGASDWHKFSLVGLIAAAVAAYYTWFGCIVNFIPVGAMWLTMVIVAFIVYWVVSSVCDLFSGRKRGSFQSWCIRWWTNPEGSWKPWKLAEVSHVGIAIWLSPDIKANRRLCVVEAIGSGARATFLSEAVKSYHGPLYWKKLDKTSNIDGAIVASCGWNKVGRLYPPLTQYIIIGFPWVRKLMHKVGIQTDVAPDADCCSEYVAREYIEAGYEADKPAQETAPIEVWSWDIFIDKQTLEV